jgi:hypothetical protein
MSETTSPKKDFKAIKPVLLKSLNDTLYRACSPPPDKLIIPEYRLLPGDEPGQATAEVLYVIKHPTEKTHSVNISFCYDRRGKFLEHTMNYV